MKILTGEPAHVNGHAGRTCVICGGTLRHLESPCPACEPASVLYRIEAIDYRGGVENWYESPSANAVASWLTANGYCWTYNAFRRNLPGPHGKQLMARIRFGGDCLTPSETRQHLAAHLGAVWQLDV